MKVQTACDHPSAVSEINSCRDHAGSRRVGTALIPQGHTPSAPSTAASLHMQQQEMCFSYIWARLGPQGRGSAPRTPQGPPQPRQSSDPPSVPSLPTWHPVMEHTPISPAPGRAALAAPLPRMLFPQPPPPATAPALRGGVCDLPPSRRPCGSQHPPCAGAAVNNLSGLPDYCPLFKRLDLPY